MTWSLVDDRFPWHRKVAPLSDASWRLHVTAIVHANAELTDGRIPRALPATWPRAPRGRALARCFDELVTARVWEPTEDGYGWQIHDFGDWNLLKEQVLSRRDARRQAGQLGGQRSAEAKQALKQPPEQMLGTGSSSHQANFNPSPSPSPRSDPPVVPPPVRKRRAVRSLLPDGWAPSSETVAWAIQSGVSEREIPGVIAEFSDYWRGRGDLQADWTATFRNHVRRLAERRGLKPKPSPQLALGSASPRRSEASAAKAEEDRVETLQRAAAEMEAAERKLRAVGGGS